MSLVIRLTRRDPGVPWGFGMQGGIDCGQPLTVSCVVPGGLASCCGLQNGVRILSIGGDATDCMTYQQAQQAVIRCSNDLELEVCDPNYRGYICSQAYAPCSNSGVVNGPPVSCSTLNIDLHRPTGCRNSSPPSPRRSCSESINKTYKPLTNSVTKSRESHSPCSPCSSTNQEPVSSYRQWQLPKPSNAALDKPQCGPKPTVSEISNPCPSSTSSLSSSNCFQGKEIILKKSVLRPHNFKPRPVCYSCKEEIHGPFIDTIKYCFCPDHFKCCLCFSPLNNLGFAEHDGKLYCEDDFTKCVAPKCAKCFSPIIGQITKALDKNWHPHCFACMCCAKPLQDRFYIEEGDQVLCEEHWQKLHLTPCGRCQQPISEIDRFVEAFGKQFHARCFCCAACQTPLEGKPFHTRDNKPFCRVHAHAVALYG